MMRDTFLESQEVPVELSEYMRVLQKRWVLIAVIAVVATLVAIALSLILPKQYEATAKVLISAGNAGQTLVGTLQSGTSNQPEVDLDTQISLMQQEPLIRGVIQGLRLGTTPEELLKKIKISADGSTHVVSVSATALDPNEAAKIANTLAGSYVSWSREHERASVRTAAQEVDVRLTAVRKELASLGAANPQRDPTGAQGEVLTSTRALLGQLTDTKQQLLLAEQLATGYGSVVASAMPDPRPVSPNPLRNALVGLVLGLAVGVGLAFVLAFQDKGLDTPEQAADLYGVPLMGVIPAVPASSQNGDWASVAGPKATPASEGYRRVRSSLSFINFERRLKTVLVTSAVPSEGKSTLAANLSAVLAQAGWKVCLIVCDFRLPTIRTFFRLPGRIGLSEVLIGSAQIADALQQPPGGPESLSVMVSGAMPPNPSELLSSSSMSRMLATLGESFDYVILDSPPVLAVADTPAMARLADGVVMVGRIGVSRRDTMQLAKDELDNVGARIVGVAILGGEDRSGGGYGYHAAADAAERSAE